MSIAREAVSCWEMRGHRGGILILVIDPPVCLWSTSQCLSPRVCCLWTNPAKLPRIICSLPMDRVEGTCFGCVYDLYLTHFWKFNHLRCLFVHLLTLSGVKFSGVYSDHLLKLCFVATHHRLCTYVYPVNSDVLRSRHLPQDFYTTASRADLE